MFRYNGHVNSHHNITFRKTEYNTISGRRSVSIFVSGGIVGVLWKSMFIFQSSDGCLLNIVCDEYLVGILSPGFTNEIKGLSDRHERKERLARATKPYKSLTIQAKTLSCLHVYRPPNKLGGQLLCTWAAVTAC